jgi:hypothetical protein
MNPEKLCDQAELKDRHERGHDAPQLPARDKDFRSLVTRRQGWRRDHIEAGAGEDDRQVKRKIAGLPAVESQAMPARQLS